MANTNNCVFSLVVSVGFLAICITQIALCAPPHLEDKGHEKTGQDWYSQLKSLEKLLRYRIDIHGHEDNEVLDSGERSISEKKAGESPTEPLFLKMETGILQQLTTNAKRMDTMLTFLSDLRDVLSTATKTQAKQMRFEKEVVELREGLENLRKEVHHIKSEQLIQAEKKDYQSLSHQVQNNGITIQWLKDSSAEVQKEIKEITSVCNATTLLQVQKSSTENSQRHENDLRLIQRQLEELSLKQLQQSERIKENKIDVEDVRTWQVKMGQTAIKDQRSTSTTMVASGKMRDVVNEEENFLNEALKNIDFPSNPKRHVKRLKQQLAEINKVTRVLGKDHYHMSQRLDLLERAYQDMTSRDHSTSNNGTIPSSNEKRISNLENSLNGYASNLQNIADQTTAVNDLQVSITQLFSTLDKLESRYDERLTEMQTNMAKLDATMNSAINSNDQLKEDQNYQSRLNRNSKKELLRVSGQLQKNHLMLASLQTQLLKWSSQKCSTETSESIQDIRISSLESLTQILKGQGGK